jgi:hypothetical protein
MRRGAGLSAATAVAVAGMVMATAGTSGASAASGDATTTTTVVYQGEFGPDGKMVQKQTTVPVTVRNTLGGTKPAGPAPKPAIKLDPRLAAMANEMTTASGRQRVIVTFKEDRKIPRFPDLDPALPRTAPVNVQAQTRSDAIVNDLTAQRQAGYQALSSDLARMDVRTLDTYWLIKGMVVDAPVSALAALAQRSDVSYIGPVETETRPPDADPFNDESFARLLMKTDGYFNLGQTSGFVGILDTGVRATHTLFNNPSKPWIREDLTNPASPNPDDDCWNHGTSTAAILTGNGNLGNAFRGVTGITVDSFKVYPANCGGLNTDAAVKGFQRAVQVGDRVIVAEMQGLENENGRLAMAADGAFDAGAVVIAANGNQGPNPGTVNSPAVAEKVLGIGSVDVETGATPTSQSLGPAPDGRIKPDLQAPTNVETASNASDTATQVFTGTSGATPHAAGAAALIRNYLRGGNADIDPGAVYAFLLAAGNSFSGSATVPPINNTSGAGVIRLPVAPATWQSSANSVSNGQSLSLPISFSRNFDQLNVAIWWAEQPDPHNDVDLTVIDPNGVVRGSSLSSAGVFERVNIVGPVVAGNWTVQVHGYSVPSSAVRVHMVAITR